MKFSYVFTFALVAVVLFISSTSIAQGDHNEFGFYVDSEMSGTHVAAAIYSQIEVYMIITYPYNEDLGRPVESIYGIEFRSFYPSDAAVVIATNWAEDGIDFGSLENGHLVGFGMPLQNVNNAIYIGSKSYLLLTADPFGIYLALFAGGPSIPGHMAFWEFESDTVHAMYPSSGSYDDPVFGVNMEVVATEKSTFGDLKALYR